MMPEWQVLSTLIRWIDDNRPTSRAMSRAALWCHVRGTGGPHPSGEFDDIIINLEKRGLIQVTKCGVNEPGILDPNTCYDMIGKAPIRQTTMTLNDS